MRHDAFSVRNESMVLVVFNRAFNSTVLEYALKEQRNVTIDVGLPPWMPGLDGLVAQQLLGSAGVKELALESTNIVKWSHAVRLRIPRLGAGTVVNIMPKLKAIETVSTDMV